MEISGVNGYALDEKVRKGYERTVREIRCNIAKADERPGTGRSSVQFETGTNSTLASLLTGWSTT